MLQASCRECWNINLVADLTEKIPTIKREDCNDAKSCVMHKRYDLYGTF